MTQSPWRVHVLAEQGSDGQLHGTAFLRLLRPLPPQLANPRTRQLKWGSNQRLKPQRACRKTLAEVVLRSPQAPREIVFGDGQVRSSSVTSAPKK